jgi:hypothetical protein
MQMYDAESSSTPTAAAVHIDRVVCGPRMRRFRGPFPAAMGRGVDSRGGQGRGGSVVAAVAA